MTARPEIVVNDKQVVVSELTKDKETFIIDQTAIVKAMIVDKTFNRALSPVIEVLSTNPGADWSVSRVSVKIEKSDTVNIRDRGNAYIELQITENGYDDTWHIPVYLKSGLIP